jgi:hypothetical protein
MPTPRINRLLVLAAAAVAFAHPAAAQHAVLRVGSHVRIIAPSVARGWLDARLVRLVHDTLALETRTFRRRHLSLPLAAVSRLEVRVDPRVGATKGPSPAAVGAVIGGAIGLTAGTLLAVAAEDFEDCTWNLTCVVIPMLGAAAGAAIGGTVGGVAGDAATSAQPWIPVPIERLAGATVTATPEPAARPVRRAHRDLPLLVTLLIDVARP